MIFVPCRIIPAAVLFKGYNVYILNLTDEKGIDIMYILQSKLLFVLVIFCFCVGFQRYTVIISSWLKNLHADQTINVAYILR